MEEVKLLDISRIDEIGERTKESIKGIFSEGDTIAIKMHFGEPGNPNYISAEITKQIVDALKKNGIKPFLFDSCVNYVSPRNDPVKHVEAVAEHGFTEEAMGCPIIVSEEFVGVNTEHLTIEVCKHLADADGMLVLSHVKGHPCAGFGAAIKNLGMGGVTKKSKKDIHDGSKPNIDVKTCIGCGTCVNVCPAKALELKDKKSVLNEKVCWGCSICIYHCPVKAMSPKNELFDILLAEGAQAVLKAVKKSYFINIINNVARFCDCFNHDSEKIAKDVGVVFSKDIVAADKAAYDLVVEREGSDVFEEHNNKSPLLQIKAAEKLGLGSTKYKLTKC